MKTHLNCPCGEAITGNIRERNFDGVLTRAAQDAQDGKFADALAGYDTVLDDEASNVSAGEKQLLTIARAFLAKPSVLILDEATSSVDTRTELLVQRAMSALRKDRTSFVIAHRLSTIRAADQILVLEQGEIVERGTHRELLSKGGRYKQLYDRQYQFESDRFINPGEDFTPEDEAAKAAGRVVPANRL